MRTTAIKKTFPLAISAIPFGIVMGTSTYNTQFDTIQMLYMNLMMFAGASQLAFIELFLVNSPNLIILISCLLINSRMFLYSLALFEEFKDLSFLKKILLSYFVIDQTYVVYEESKDNLKTKEERFQFFLTSGLFMFSFWMLGVCIGYFIGDILPFKEDLDFLVPLVFIGIFGSKLNTHIARIVFGTAVILSLLCFGLPYNLGLLVSSISAMFLGVLLVNKESIK